MNTPESTPEIEINSAPGDVEPGVDSFQQFIELAPDAILLVDPEGRISLVNSQFESMFGYSREAMRGQPVEVLIPGCSREAHLGLRNAYQARPRSRPMGPGLDLVAQRRDGVAFPVEISLGPVHYMGQLQTIAMVRDVTDRRQAQAERERLLESEREKTEQLKLAVREAHHRIKNNLQAISDLLYLTQSAQPMGDAHDALGDSIGRIQSIALVHDLLSQEEDVETVDLHALTHRLAPMVVRNAGCAIGASVLTINVPTVAVSSRRATMISLILTELCSNSVRHAFRGGAEDRLLVQIDHINDGLRIVVQDSGPGVPRGFSIDADANVGLQVVKMLAERDLGGTLTLESTAGLRVTVWFPW